MRRLFFLLVCFACTCDSRRVQLTRSDESPRKSKDVAPFGSLPEDSANADEKASDDVVPQSERSKPFGDTLISSLYALREDIPKLFSKEPTWTNMAHDITVTDQATGATLEGLAGVRSWLKLFQKFEWENLESMLLLDTPAFIQCVRTRAKENPLKSCDPLLIARWRGELKGMRLPLLRFWEVSEPAEHVVLVELEASFHLDSDGNVSYVNINKWIVNGMYLDMWPQMKLMSSLDKNFEALQDWLAMVDLNENNDLLRLLHSEEPESIFDQPIPDESVILTQNQEDGDFGALPSALVKDFDLMNADTLDLQL